MQRPATTAEAARLAEASDQIFGWRRWGPYVSERSWATVREDYSSDGNAWRFLPHDLARSKAYRWGEDGIAGICDRYQVLVFAPAFWNGRDPILKERLFGLTPEEGNHGEDVKEYYFHVDNTPTHSYMRYVYKYPQAEYPYQRLIDENRARCGRGLEFELLDTGVFDDDRYFDITIEYAKADEEDICIRIEAVNRGPDPAPLHLIPHLWFRNTWSWGNERGPEPVIECRSSPRGTVLPNRPSGSGEPPYGDGPIQLIADDANLEPITNLPVEYRLGRRVLFAPPGGEPLFTDNETNVRRVFGEGWTNPRPFVKDAFHRQIIGGEQCTNPARRGTKAALHYKYDAVPPGESVVLRLRLSDKPELNWKPDASAREFGENPTRLRGTPANASGSATSTLANASGYERFEPALEPRCPLTDIDAIITDRRREADEFYDSIHPPNATDDERLIQRQALAGLLWNKQSYIFDVSRWLEGDNPDWPPPASRQKIRNAHWKHLNSLRVMTLPDKWEYPWFAAWDLAFQCVSLALVDPEYAMDQLWVLLFEQFQHPNGQIPAYEWEFSDLNPPVHAWAVWRVYNMAKHRGHADRGFLERCFHKLLINFAWWVNKVDSQGNNVFEGGFLGLDNITVFDRSVRFADGVVLEQSDATGWMGMFCLNLMRIALELAKENPEYQRLATKFFQHFVYVAAAMKHMGGRDYQLWDEKDGFFYDVLRHPDGRFRKIRVRSLVGLIPLFAIEQIEEEQLRGLSPFAQGAPSPDGPEQKGTVLFSAPSKSAPNFFAEFTWFLKNRQDLVADIVRPIECDGKTTYVLSIVNQDQITRLLRRLWDSGEFLSDYGIRSLSKAHEQHPLEFEDKSVRYEPAEADCKIKGGNSNWRGPIWFPTNFLLIESLRKLGKACGPGFTIESPDASRAPLASATERSETKSASAAAPNEANKLTMEARRVSEGALRCTTVRSAARPSPSACPDLVERMGEGLPAVSREPVERSNGGEGEEVLEPKGSAPSGAPGVTTGEMAAELADRLIHIFRSDATTGRRAVFGGAEKFQRDPHWRDLLLFYEYFHGDTATGLGASHQTGWTALVASLIDEWRR